MTQDTNPIPLNTVPPPATLVAAFGVSTSQAPSRQLGTVAVIDRIAVYKAAKIVHRSPAYVMTFINNGLLKPIGAVGRIIAPGWP